MWTQYQLLQLQEDLNSEIPSNKINNFIFIKFIYFMSEIKFDKKKIKNMIKYSIKSSILKNLKIELISD